MDQKRIVGITVLTGVVGVGLYFARHKLFGGNSELLDEDEIDISTISDTNITDADISDGFKDDRKLIAINEVIKKFAEWKVTTFKIDNYSSIVALAAVPTTTDNQLIQDIGTKSEQCNLDDPVICGLKEIAVNLLVYYFLNSYKKEYLDTAERIVKILFENKLKSYDPNITNPYNFITLMSNIGNLPILFEYIADDSYNNTRLMCHKFIIKLIPDFHPSYADIFNEEAVTFNLLRMLTNYLFNDWNFREDSSDRNLQKLIDAAVQLGLQSYSNITYDNTLRGKLFKALMTS